MARAASKSFLAALKRARMPRCKAAHTTDRCEREEGHKGRHHATIEGGMTMDWTDKKSSPHKRSDKGDDNA